MKKKQTLARFVGRRAATLAAAGTLVIAAAAVAPSAANATVTFGDGVQMFVSFSCSSDGSYSMSVFNGSQQLSYARTRFYSYQSGRLLHDSGWLGAGNAFTIWGPMRWPYGRGWFVFRSLVGRYVNGQWVMARDVDHYCYFAR